MARPTGPKRKYYCDCPRYCKTLREVGKSTYNDHARYMLLDATPRNAPLPRAPRQSNPTPINARNDVPNNVRGPELPNDGDTMSAPPEDSTASGSGDGGIPQEQREPPADPGSLVTLRGEEEGNSGGLEHDGHHDEDPAAVYSNIEEVRTTQQYIQALRDASLYNGDLSPDAIEALLHPPDYPLELDPEADDDLLMCLRLFLGGNNSEKLYNNTRETVKIRHPGDDILSYDQLKRKIRELTGICPIIDDMCPNSCLAYTGPYREKQGCHRCGESRFDPVTERSRQQAYTIPIGFAIQALKRHAKTAAQMDYFWKRAQELLAEQQRNGVIEVIDDIVCGTDILQAVLRGDIQEHDTVLMFSFDGAQLYRNKISDCWMSIWNIVCFSPDLRYKKRFILPGTLMPGPKKIKMVESFLHSGLQHIAAINKAGGLPVWDASRNKMVTSKLYIALATADGPGMTYLNGLVGHSGKVGCRLWCGLVGRHKPGAPMHYPVLSKPDNYTVAGCDHDDVPPHIVRSIDKERYLACLERVCNARTQAEYELQRRETGICKPSIFSGLPDGTYLGIPNMFPGDIMHLVLNIADLLVGLWRGKLDCSKTSDSTTTWPWAVLVGETWNVHGKDVAQCTPFLPGSFDRPPRNPAEKINSGYKAWEFLLYIFGLGPGLFYGILPDSFWQSYCKLVAAVRFIYQRRIRTKDQLTLAHRYLIEFVAEYEALYVLRRADRLHFVRPIVHALTHLALEALRIGPGIASSQWTMERTIGNLTEEIKQDSTPYANLSRRSVERVEVNCLKALLPEIDREAQRETSLPRGSINLGDGYVLLHAMDSCARGMSDSEADAFREYLEADESCGPNNIPTDWIPSIVRWSRLLLPHGQVARSLWKEHLKPLGKIRTARRVKLTYKGQTEFGDVRYYFQFKLTDITTRTLAVISLYSPPDAELLSISSGTLWSCRHQGDAAVIVIDVKCIEAVVAVVPHSTGILGEEWNGRVFVVEKPGLDVSIMAGYVERIPEEDDIPEDNGN
ncbi:hypothetical protein FPV67DRAFT_1782455 [Lyophyllum atratum]|nr:hypothetical protein FPV67DRAFT_1782455 [Lyophyllum atratum]